MTFEPLKEKTAIWKLLPPGSHGRIVPVLEKDDKVKKALAAFDPAKKQTRTDLIETISRATGACIGEVVVHRKLNPADQTVSIYRVLKSGTDKSIVAAIDALTNDQLDLPPGASKQPVKVISRMVGRCIGQEAVDESGGVLGLIEKLLKKLIPFLP